MKRIAMLTAAMGASLMGSLAGLGHNVVTIDRERPVSAKRRRVAPAVRVNGRSLSKYMPHQGSKERERARRCWMSAFHGPMSDFPRHPRSAPTMHQMSKRDQLPF